MSPPIPVPEVISNPREAPAIQGGACLDNSQIVPAPREVLDMPDLALAVAGLPPGAKLPCGQYKVKSARTSDSAIATEGAVVSDDWFSFDLGLLSAAEIERIGRIQLLTESRDQGFVSFVSSGNWTWFEVCVSWNEGGQAKEHRWMSHENAFLVKDPEVAWREGKIFGQDHDLLKLVRSFKGEDKPHLRVRASACFPLWQVVAKQGILIFDIGCKTFAQDILLNPARYCNIAVAGPNISAPDDKLLLDAANEAVSYWGANESHETLVASFAERKPSVLIYKATTLSDAQRLASADSGLKSRLLVVMDAVNLLPESDRCLSWDQTLTTFSTVERLGFHLLIRLDHDGAIYRSPLEESQVLIFDPRNAQGHFIRSFANHEAIDKDVLKANLDAAYLAGLAASLAKESSGSLDELCETQIKEAATIALRWSRRYAATKQGKIDATLATWHSMKLDTPDDPVLVPAQMPLQVDAQSHNSLLFNTLPFQPPKYAAWDIVKKGAEYILSFVPTARFSKFEVADSKEVHMFRNIARKVEEYIRRDSPLVPLPIAVFGQPGSGKSFGVEAVITSIMREAKQQDKMKLLKFNLSQFQEPSDLQVAFETVRDEYMAGKLPVVLFDEFDTASRQTPLFWLRHLVEPIKNGTFTVDVDGQPHTRSLGRGIYAFIGGTAKTFQEFEKGSSTIASISSPVNNNHGNGMEAVGLVPNGCQFIDQFLTTQLGDLRGKTHHFKVSPGQGYSGLVKFFYKARECTDFRKLPVVYIEGFDTDFAAEGLGWLKYFLAPMQDGAFIDNGHSRPIGRAVFVFVGGESGAISRFLDRPEQREEAFQAAKGPDFVSRLRGFVSPTEEDPSARLMNVVERYKNGKEPKPLSLAVLRPPGNEQVTQHSVELDSQGVDEKRSEFTRLVHDQHVDIMGPNKVAVDDNMFQVRRAILLRSMLNRLPEEEKFELSNEVLNAMLGVDTFHHGARSIEAILSMSRLPNRGNELTTAHLPEDTQLGLHVDVVKFRGLLRDPHIPGEDSVRDRQLMLRTAEMAWARARIRGEVAPEQMDFTAAGPV